MTRSIFFAFFLRLALAMAFIIGMRTWLVPHGWILPTLLVLAWASLSAYLLARSVRSSIVPLQISASTISGRSTPTDAPISRLAAKLSDSSIDQGYSDFDNLARSLSRASREVQRALGETTASRHELEAMIDSLQDAVVAVDLAGRIQWSNRRMQRLIPSWNPATSATSTVRVGHALVQTIRDPDVLECVRSAIEHRSFCQRRTTSLVPGRIFEVNASPMPSGGVVALMHDVTRIEQVERTQRDFVANVSHELRTPLTSITGYVETLLDHETSLTPQARSFLATILKNATRMNRLTEDLLTMARVESSEQELHPAPIAADILVRDAVQAMAGLLQDANAFLEIADVCSTEVMADADAVVQVLSNLIENAIKYGRDRTSGIARVVVSASLIPGDVPSVEFSVRDFGSGIASEHLPRLFERFYRVDKARSLESGGTGLGLAIARHMVQSQGGTIRAESELNAGSTFLFTLPLAPPLLAREPARTGTPPNTAGEISASAELDRLPTPSQH